MAGPLNPAEPEIDGAETGPEDEGEAAWAEFEALDAAEDAEGEPPEEGRVTDGDEGDEGDAGDADGIQSPPTEVVAAAGETQPKPVTEMTREELLAERQALQAQLAKVQHSDVSQRGRISALSRQLEELRAAAKPAGPTIDERLKQVREEYPEIAEPILEVVNDIRRETDLQRQERQQKEAERREAEVKKVHPDFDTYVREHQAEFTAFFDRAPAAIRQAFVDNADGIADEGNAILALTTFKNFVQATTPKQGQPAPKGATPQQPQGRRERQMAAAAAAPTARSTVSPNNPASGSPDDDWDYFERLDREKERRRGAR